MSRSATDPSPRQWRNVTVVRQRDDRRVRRLWGWLIGLVVALTPSAFYLLQQMEYVQVRYRIEELRAERTRLADEERRLRVERATLEALPRVESRAADRLGLVTPPPDRVVVVRPPAARQAELVARAPDGKLDAR